MDTNPPETAGDNPTGGRNMKSTLKRALALMIILMLIIEFFSADTQC